MAYFEEIKSLNLKPHIGDIMKSAKVRISIERNFARKECDYIHYMADQLSRSLIDSVIQKLTERIEKEINSHIEKHPEHFNIEVVASIPEKLDEIISFTALIYTHDSFDL